VGFAPAVTTLSSSHRRRVLPVLGVVWHTTNPRRTTALSFSSSHNNKDFEYQEMKVLLDAMKQQGVSSIRGLDAEKGRELQQYVQQVAGYRRSSSLMLTPHAVNGTVWRLAFTTERALPRDATLYLVFPDDEHNSLLRYSLQFGKKTLGLHKLEAVSRWTVSNNVLTFVYDTITMDAFGFSNIELCFFGLLKGRSNYIETAFFDGDVWIEQQPQQSSSGRLDGSDSDAADSIWNVYVREDDTDAWR
jgi:hypothetical protein